MKIRLTDYCINSQNFGGRRETRTHTALLPLDFESNASTSSAIRPFLYSLMFAPILYGVAKKTLLKFIFISPYSYS